MKYEFLVSDEIEEIIFGADWLVANRCSWDFEDGVLWIRSENEQIRVSLVKSGPKRCIRRIYARQTVELKPHSQSDVAVKTVWSSLPSGSADWLVEPKELCKGVIMARTLLPSDGSAAFVRVINCSPVSCSIQESELLANAEAIDRLPPRATTTLTEHHVQPAGADVNHGTQAVRGQQTSTSGAYDHVQCLMDALPDELSSDQQRRATEFIRSYAHIFSRSETDLGRNGMLPHRINTGNHLPIRQPLRRQPYAHQAEIERNIQAMLAAKVIEPAQSPWQSNVLLIPKRDKSWRFCIDYRALNFATVKDSYPLPRVSACLDALGGSRLFSTLDLRAGFWQTELAEEDADKSAFCSRSGQYRFRVLSVGLANAPASSSG